MKVTQIEKLNQLISRTDMTGNQKVDWLINFIDEHVTEQLRIHNVSVRDFIVGDVVFTQDGRIWVINGINGDDLLVDGNGKRNYPLEKCDVSHAH